MGRHKSPRAGSRISWHGLTTVYANGHAALDDCDGAIEAGELAVVMGPSGSGKTTLLRLLCGLQRATAGRVTFDNQDVTHWPAHRRHAALVSQTPALYPHWTVADNLLRGATIAGEQAWDVAAALGVARLWDRYPATLSGGESQRVALARAVLRRPRLLLMDEPFAHIDSRQRYALRTWLRKVHEQFGGTLLFVTHDPLEAAMLADRVLVLHNGRIVQQATPRRLWTEPVNRSVADRLGDVTLNYFAGSFGWSEQQRVFRAAGMELELPTPSSAGQDPPTRSGSALLGVWPEDMSLLPAGTPGGLNGRVESIEYLGTRSIVHVVLDDAALAAENVPASDDQPPGQPSGPRAARARVITAEPIAVQPGAAVTVRPCSDRLYFFDRTTGNNLMSSVHN